MPNTIALVDDDRNILTSVSMALEAEGFTVRTYTDGAEALRGLTAQPVDLAILDIKMPRMDGMELLAQLRKESAMPVIFLTSKDDEVDEVLGLRMGADDYIKKPFSQRLLVERIRALAATWRTRARGHRRRSGAGDSARRAAPRSGAPSMHLERRERRSHRDRISVPEVPRSRPGHVKSRDQLMDGAYGEHIYVDDRTIDSHVKALAQEIQGGRHRSSRRLKRSMASDIATATTKTGEPAAAATVGISAAKRRRVRRRRFSPLTWRILAVNVLALALSGRRPALSRRIPAELDRRRAPIAEDAGPDFAAALGEGAVVDAVGTSVRLTPQRAREMMRRLVEPT